LPFIYYAELGQPNSQIHSIPDAFWWAIVTMTTVTVKRRGISWHFASAKISRKCLLKLSLKISRHLDRYMSITANCRVILGHLSIMPLIRVSEKFPSKLHIAVLESLKAGNFIVFFR